MANAETLRQRARVADEKADIARRLSQATKAREAAEREEQSAKQAFEKANKSTFGEVVMSIIGFIIIVSLLGSFFGK